MMVDLFALGAGGATWMARAACRAYPPDLFDSHVPDRTAQQALTVCAGCPVRQPCYEYAAGHGESGVWGGAVFDGGRQVGAGDPTGVCVSCGGPFVRPQRHPNRQHCYTCRPWRKLRPCGTHAAYMRHFARGEQPCALCRAAEAAYTRRRKENR